MFATRKLILSSLVFVVTVYAHPEKITLKSRFGAGFFAELQTVFAHIILTLCNEPEGKEIEVEWVDEFFPYKNSKTENGWDLFFEPIGVVARTRGVHAGEIIHDQTCLRKWLLYDDLYNYRLGMHKILTRYIRIKPAITEEANRYYASHMNGKPCIGVQVRFSVAHDDEKPAPLDIQDYFDVIDALIKTIGKHYVIYLATDSKYVVTKFQEKYKRKLLYIDAVRSRYKEEVHLMYENPNYWIGHPEKFLQMKPGYKGGKDVLIDCLLLSKCQYFVHTTSNVADFVTFFNPDITSIYLPKLPDAGNRLCAACNCTDAWYRENF